MRERYNAWLAEHRSLYTYVDAAQCAGLPSYLRGLTNLKIGLNLPLPVDPLLVCDWGILAGLSFNRRVQEVRIPWAAVAAVRSPAHALLRYDSDLLARLANEREQAEAAPKSAGNVVKVDFAAKRRART